MIECLMVPMLHVAKVCNMCILRLMCEICVATPWALKLLYKLL